MNILEFAIKTELDGEDYYKRQAAADQGNSLNTALLLLAEDECNRAKVLSRKSEGPYYELTEPAPHKKKNVYYGMADLTNEVCEVPEQVDLYRMVLENEKQSKRLYKEFLSITSDDREMYSYLILKENRYIEIMEDIIKMVNRPNEWVEAAEFGIREEY